MPEAYKVEKLRDHGYMDLGYSGFVNGVGIIKKVDAPTKGDMGFFARENKAIKGDNEKAKYMLETKDFYNYQRNKE
jgi:hypothetical protein